MPTDAEARVLLSIEDAAARLSVSERTLRRAVARGEIRSVRIGRRCLIPMAALTELAERGVSEAS